MTIPPAASARPQRPSLLRPLLVCTATVMLLGGGSAVARVLDRIIAQVNDRIITLSELHERLAPAVYELRRQYEGEKFQAELQKVRAGLLNTMVDEILLLQHADEMGIAIEEQALAAAIAEVKDRAGIATDEELSQALTAEGMNLATYRAHLRDQLKVMRVIGVEVRSKIDILDSEITARYEETKETEFVVPERVSVWQILRKLPPEATPEQIDEARKASTEVLAKLKDALSGVTDFASRAQAFAALAKSYSEEPAGQEGGDIGSFARGQMVAELEKVAFALEVGGYSEPVQTEFGFHIVFVAAHSATSYRPLDEVRDAISDALFKERFDAARRDYIARLRDRAYVSVLGTAGEATESSVDANAGAGKSAGAAESAQEEK
ncbi:MAG: peptidylprolyl isomerase [Candidatus Schekmanbacteria bacterium]|nr:peptidylprolyl isomerase [Candidatus Schekmanbacteria bacterium]